jgi:hypothetical protein
MADFMIHVILLVCAGVALFLLWRKTASSDRLIDLMIAIGFLARAVLGQVLFWISYARLPFGRSLQMGDGLWFFAVDAFQYYPQAIDGANRGVWAILTYNRATASVSFVQALATSILLFGRVASVALVLNLFCFLGMAFVIVRWSARHERARMAGRIAIAAIALSPAFIVWSSQPLKDTLFQFMVIAFMAACAAWQRGWATAASSWSRVAAGASMSAAMVLLSGIRWYFAFVILMVASAFAVLVALRAPNRKSIAFASAAGLLIVLSRAFLYGGGAYVPDQLRDALTLSANASTLVDLPSTIAGRIENARRGFELSGGATQIGAGTKIAKLETAPPPQPKAVTAAPSKPPEQPAVVAVPPLPPPPEVSASAQKTSSRQKAVAAPPSRRHVETAVARKPEAPVVKKPAEVPAPPAEQPRLMAKPVARPVANPILRTTPKLTSQPALAPAAPAQIVAPKSRAGRLAAGAAAVLVPRMVGQRTGLIQISGGKNLWWFSDIDTVFFDLIALIAIFSILRSLRHASFRNPIFWLIVAVTVLISFPLIYTVTNFGTLFRLREMIYLGLVLIPLALATAPQKEPVRVTDESATDVPSMPDGVAPPGGPLSSSIQA